jgi:AraC family transcriptional regulator, regulatory protein of adaptative response / methylated-DNA-[protein]-cysteine methyltransferase
MAARTRWIRIGRGPTPIGNVLVAFTAQGICALRLEEPTRSLKNDMQKAFPDAVVIEDDKGAATYVEQITEFLAGRRQGTDIRLDLHGTPFQLRVWQAMLRVPRGTTCSYSDLARRAGRPRAVRAVANACARNPVALIVPCHRIIRSDGSLGGYFYGLKRKRAILEHEQCGV